MSTAAASPPHRSGSAIVLSLGFWGCVFGATVLFGSVALAPRVVEWHDLQRRFATRQGELLTLQGENDRLNHVVTGLRSDAAFARSIARHELRGAPSAPRTVTLSDDLRFDPRQPAADPIDVAYTEPWYLPILAELVQSPTRRIRWSMLAAGLLAFGFVFLHEHAGSRAVGRLLGAPFRWCAVRYASRPR
jgi:hypothetical protein